MTVAATLLLHARALKNRTHLLETLEPRTP